MGYQPMGLDDAIRALGSVLALQILGCFDEPQLERIEMQVRQRITSFEGAPFSSLHNGDSVFARFCYAITRALRPRAIVETGVCYGVTSAYILQALEVNGGGHLYSIDLPPLAKNSDQHVGGLIPLDLKRHWSLHRGTSRRLLEPLLANLGAIDIFIHDSLHTYENMKQEFAAAWPVIRPGGVLISDDIEGNTAFQELSGSLDVESSVVIAETQKNSFFGIAVKKS